MKIALTTIGCKLNQSEIQDMQNDLLKAGHIIVTKNQSYDLHIINACSITHGAEQITRQKISVAKRKNPQAHIFIMGCYNQSIPEVAKIFRNRLQVLKYIKKNYPISQSQASAISLEQLKTRAQIKIQDGCDFNCSYCIITKFRGKSRSISPTRIINQIKLKEKQGYQEIIIVGVNILFYKYDRTNFVDLAKKILRETKILRIRFSSLDPRLINANFLALLKNSRICPHLHLSLQSGSNKILKLMNRNYTSVKYLNIVKSALKINPLISITTDIIVGFPGETDRYFQTTLNFVKKINFLKIHIFPYSRRTGTKAANFKNQIDAKTRKERFNKLNALIQKHKNKFLRKMRGQTLPVLFEQKKNGYWQGYTPNYILGRKKDSRNLRNKIIKIKI